MTEAAPAPALPSGLDEHSVFRSLFFAYPDAMLLVDQGGRIVLANPAAEQLLGYARDELIGLNVDALVPDAIRPRHAAYRQAYGQAPRARPMGAQMALVAQCRDGSQVAVEIALSPLHEHRLPLVVAAIRGVAEYPRVKQALKRARYSEHLAQLGRLAVDARELQSVVDQIPALAAAALEVEVARVFLLAQDRAWLRVASGVGEIAGEPVGSRLPNQPDSSPGRVLATGLPLLVADYRLERRFSVPAHYLDAGLAGGLAVPLSDRGRTIGALSVCSRQANRFGDDELRFLESAASLLATSLQRAASEEALNHALRLESVGQLSGGIAHDFNNLLTVIQGNLQVLDDLPADATPAQRQPMLSAATRATRRGAELTAKLLAFSRRQVLQPTAVDAGAMLGSLADMLQRTLDQRIRVAIELPPGGGPWVLADPSQLESALLNIAINARDAMPEGGSLRFRAGVVDAAADELPPGLAEPIDSPGRLVPNFAAISVSDSGSGMSEAVKERAFEPFFTTKGAGRGTGLGLSTVYGFVKQSRGAVVLDSAPGAGTGVTLYLPLAAAPAAASDAVADALDADPAPALPADLAVLLVEDDPEVRAVVHSHLQALGCRVWAAASGEQALLLLADNPGVALLLSDIALGAGMRGTALAALAQARLPGLAVLLMSGFSAELLEADRVAPRHWELLQKPFARDALAQAMARLFPAR